MFVISFGRIRNQLYNDAKYVKEFEVTDPEDAWFKYDERIDENKNDIAK